MPRKQTPKEIVRRHGIGGFALFCFARLLRKLTRIEICKISETDNALSYPAVDGYPMLVLHRNIPLPVGHEATAALQAFLQQQSVPIEAGHHAVVTLCGERVVGHNFYTLTSVEVKPGIDFDPGEGYYYSYGAHTDPDFRGKGLSPARWTFFRDWRRARGMQNPVVSYIALDNLSSLASGSSSNSLVLGYSCWRSPPGALCFRSWRARSNGVGFRKQP